MAVIHEFPLYGDEYFNYRLHLNARSMGYIDKGQINGGRLENIRKIVKSQDGYEILKNKTLTEISTLDKHSIKPLKIFSVSKDNKKTGRLPKFLHLFLPKTLSDQKMFLNFSGKSILFATSSRFKDAKVFKPSEKVINDFDNYRLQKKFRLVLIGNGTAAEKIITEKTSPDSILILSHLPYFSPDKPEKLINEDLRENACLSPIDPFARPGKYGYVYRNNLALLLAGEISVFYLAKNSSLINLINGFKKMEKPVKIFDSDNIIASRERVPVNINKIPPSNTEGYNPGYPKFKTCNLRQLILNAIGSFDKKNGKGNGCNNIAIDNLIKLSNINFNAGTEEVLKIISEMELNSEIERVAGGYVKKVIKK